MELANLNSLEFVSPEPQPWSQCFGLCSVQRMDRLSVYFYMRCTYISVVLLLQCVLRRNLQTCTWKSCVKNSKAVSLTFTLTIVTVWNGKFFDPCWKKAREGVKGRCFIMSGGHSCYSTLWMTVIKLKSWRGIEICCDLVLIILNSLEMRLGDFCH